MAIHLVPGRIATALILTDCDLMQERLFHLSIDKQILEKQPCAVKYLVRQVGHDIFTGLDKCLLHLFTP